MRPAFCAPSRFAASSIAAIVLVSVAASVALALPPVKPRPGGGQHPHGSHQPQTPGPDQTGQWADCSAALDASYRGREKNAAADKRSALEALKARAKSEHWTFDVGYTEVMDQSLDSLTGERLDPHFLQNASRQHAFAVEAEQIDKKLALAHKVSAPSGRGACQANAHVFNWRDAGMVTPVRKQGHCGSCWDFAAIGAYESNYVLRNSTRIDASEQYALDCATRPGDNQDAGSCNGANGGPFHGGSHAVFNWMLTHAVPTEAQDPYTQADQRCVVNALAKFRAIRWDFVSQSSRIPAAREIKQAICDHGGVVASINATPALQAYKCGVFNERNPDKGINHSIVIVGWDDNNHAWLIKNSWSTNWGIAGYGWVDYGTNNIGTAAAWVEAARERYPAQPIEETSKLMVRHGLKPSPDRQ